jgi:hypothetical protein
VKLDRFWINAFGPHAFGGNPAEAAPLEDWLADDLTLIIAPD